MNQHQTSDGQSLAYHSVASQLDAFEIEDMYELDLTAAAAGSCCSSCSSCSSSCCSSIPN